ncbi:hypothetical protein AB4383_18105 [Vibrio breoganii]
MSSITRLAITFAFFLSFSVQSVQQDTSQSWQVYDVSDLNVEVVTYSEVGGVVAISPKVMSEHDTAIAESYFSELNSG